VLFPSGALLGEWEFTWVSKEHGSGKGFWTAVRLATGQILDEFRVAGDHRETWYATSTLRSYKAGLDHWKLVSMVEGGAPHRPRAFARRAGARTIIIKLEVRA
jgi:hypothetical protein